MNPLAPAWLTVPADANELAASLWSRSTSRSQSGELTTAGVSATQLATQFGTPLFVVDEDHVRATAQLAHDSFTSEFARVGSSAKVYYAGKAFLSIEVARWVTEAGLYVDVCSGGEFAVALAAGIDPSRLALHGNNKSIAEIDRVIAAGIGVIVIDSLIEIERVADAAARLGPIGKPRKQPVRLRINTGVHASTHEFLATAREDQKFGIPLADAAVAVAGIRSHASLEFLGLHSHIGSQIFDLDGFDEAIARLLALHAELLDGGPVPELNIGGGVGINYTPMDAAPTLDLVAKRFAATVAAECERLGIAVPVVAVEPGRSIIGASTFTLYEVGTIKDVQVTLDAASLEKAQTATRKYVSIDGGMSDNVRPALYGADYSVRIANRSSTAEPALVRLAGKHCESGDIVVHADYLPGDVKPGDLVAVPATGAYCWVMSSNYNYLGRPPVVAVRGGEARLIVRGETEDDLLRRDVGMTSKKQGAS